MKKRIKARIIWIRTIYHGYIVELGLSFNIFYLTEAADWSHPFLLSAYQIYVFISHSGRFGRIFCPCFRFRRINILRTHHHGFSMVIGATHTPSSRLYAPPNFISIPLQRPSSRWTTASHSKPELSLFPHSKILEKRPKLSKSFIKSSGLTPRLLQPIEVSTKCRWGGQYPWEPALL